MAKQYIGYGFDTESPAPVAPGIVCDGWLFVSGQVPLDPEKGELRTGSIEEETRVVLENIARVLHNAGCDFDDVVRTTVHIASFDDFAGMNSVYREYFTGVLPARTAVQSVLWGGVKVEIDAIARIP